MCIVCKKLFTHLIEHCVPLLNWHQAASRQPRQLWILQSLNNSSKAAAQVTRGSACLFLFIPYLHHFTPRLSNMRCSGSSIETSALFSCTDTEGWGGLFLLRQQSYLFGDLIFVRCVTFRKNTVLCVSNLFSVVIMQAMLSDAVCSSSDILGRNQLTWLCPDASVENDNSVWTPGLSTNKCDVYFLHVFCNLFERIEAGCSFFFPPPVLFCLLSICTGAFISHIKVQTRQLWSAWTWTWALRD